MINELPVLFCRCTLITVVQNCEEIYSLNTWNTETSNSGELSNSEKIGRIMKQPG
jgi:hypothetical protein